ncbi:MAG TPA: NUDIX domain-containing protein [Bacteroidota bacterium]
MAHVSSRIVEVCVYKIVNNKPKYLLLKRAENDSLYPGIWQIVTGMAEGDENAVTTALRELSEETGFRPERLWVVPFVDVFYSAKSDTVNLTPVFAAEVKEGNEPKLSDEHQEYSWFSYEDAKKRLVWSGQKNALKNTEKNIIQETEGGRLAEIKDFTQFERKL